MRVLYISEVQWLSQASRKHHLIRRFPSDWDVLFVSPINARAGENSLIVRRDRERSSVRFVSLPLPKPDSQFSIVRASHGLLLALCRILLPAVARVYRPDIAVCSFIWAAAAVKEIQRLGVPIVYDCNDLHPYDYPQRSDDAELTFRALTAQADEVVAPTRYLRDQCGRGIIIGNGADLDLFTRSDEAPTPPLVTTSRLGTREELIAFVGSVDRKLDFPILEHLLAELEAAGRNAGVLVLGRIFEDVRERTESLARRFEDRVLFAGRVPYESLPDYLSACKVGIMPYLLNPRLEAADPSKLYIYAASALNVVSTPFSESVREHADRVYVASDPGAFADAVLAALDDDDRRLTMRDSITRGNSWDDKGKAFTALLAKLAGGLPATSD